MRVLLSFGGGISRSVFTAKTLPGQKAPMTRRTQRKGLSQERLDKIQEMIDNWKVEDANKRKEERRKRASKSESKKSKSA